MDFITHLTSLLAVQIERIPGTFWGVLAGSFFSLAGVILSNRNSVRNLIAQFENERRNRTTEREMTIRKDIYLAATEAIAVGFATVGRLADLQKEGEDLMAQYLEKSPAIAKMYIVANIDALTSVLEVQAALGAAFTQLHVERLPGLKAKRDLALASKQTDIALKRQTETLDLIRLENQNGRPDLSKWNALQAHFKLESDLVEAALQNQRPLEDAMIATQLKIAESSGKELVHLNSLLTPAIAAVRRELAMPIDETLVEKMVTRLVRKQNEGLSTLITQVRASMTPSPPIPPPPRSSLPDGPT